MNSHTLLSFRALALCAATLLVAPVLSAADGYTVKRDPAARLLKKNGLIVVSAVDDNIRSGSSRETVIERLGQPTSTMEDGTLLYSDFSVLESGASGILAIRFNGDSVNEMRLCTPAVIKALKANPKMTEFPVVFAD